MNRHDRRSRNVFGFPKTDQAMVVQVLRKGGLGMELAADVFTGWNMLVEMRKSAAGRALILQAAAIFNTQAAAILEKTNGPGSEDPDPGDVPRPAEDPDATQA